jgi:predicted nucleic acid-binding protein
MCVVVDTNKLSNVFNKNDSDHKNFSLVREYILAGKCVLVFGGTKFLNELEGSINYLRLVNTLKDTNKAVKIHNDPVDKEFDRISKLVKDTDCDDAHVIALLSASGCELICSGDKRANKYFKNKCLYTNKKMKIKIFSSNRNVSLLDKCQKVSELRNVSN